MRVIVAGSRNCYDMALLYRTIAATRWGVTTIISGGARGADALGEAWARSHGVACEVYPADWDKYGKRAGYVRNAEMAQKADALIALWDGKSRGTLNMIEIAMKARMPYRIGLF